MHMPIFSPFFQYTQHQLQYPTVDELAEFRKVQRLAYQCAEEVAKELKPGMTEKQAAKMQKVWLLDHGVTDFFHAPFAWFGERTAFNNFKVALQFFPTNKRLEEGMPFILDNAPILGEYMADIGYTGCLGENPVLEQVMDDLAFFREKILQLVKERKTIREISQQVDHFIDLKGYEARHKAYPFETLAHEVAKIPARTNHKDPFTVFGFGIDSLKTLGRLIGTGATQGWSPIWNSGKLADHKPVPGLWAVEPHLGLNGVGAKWEEMLVITDDDAFWLDDETPQMRRWRERQIVIPEQKIA